MEAKLANAKLVSNKNTKKKTTKSEKVLKMKKKSRETNKKKEEKERPTKRVVACWYNAQICLKCGIQSCNQTHIHIHFIRRWKEKRNT